MRFIKWCCLEESGQRLENVDQTHQVLAGGKLVIHKYNVATFGHWSQPQARVQSFMFQRVPTTHISVVRSR